jgi:acyl transferase domain-containing protein
MTNRLYRIIGKTSEEILQKAKESQRDENERHRPDLGISEHHISFVYREGDDINSILESKIENKINTQASIRQHKGKICYLFTGQGSQYPGMAETLYNSHPYIQNTLNRYAKILSGFNSQNYLAGLVDHDEKIHQTQFTQPAIVMLQMALTRLWNNTGMTADFFIGHSVGELSACAAQGAYTEQTTLELVAKRAELMQKTPVDGSMIAVATDRDTLDDIIKTLKCNIDYAAFNGPKQIVMSGERHSIERIKNHCSAHGIRAKILTVSHPFHSRLMSPMIKEFSEFCESHLASSTKSKNGKLISNISGDILYKTQTANYWCDHILKPVHFVQSIQNAYQHGARIFVEIGPDAVLSQLTKKILSGKEDTLIVSSLKKGRCAKDTIIEAASMLESSGQTIDWNTISALLAAHYNSE